MSTGPGWRTELHGVIAFMDDYRSADTDLVRANPSPTTLESETLKLLVWVVNVEIPCGTNRGIPTPSVFYSKSGAGNIASGQSVHEMAGGPGTNPGPSNSRIQESPAPMVHSPASPGKTGIGAAYRGNRFQLRPQDQQGGLKGPSAGWVIATGEGPQSAHPPGRNRSNRTL